MIVKLQTKSGNDVAIDFTQITAIESDAHDEAAIYMQGLIIEVRGAFKDLLTVWEGVKGGTPAPETFGE